MKLDKYYSTLYERTHKESDLIDAGIMFDKSFQIDEQIDLYTTPVHTIIENPLEEQSVIFYTGGFAPFHEGHLEAILQAKNAIETQTGETVTTALVSPDNDDYVERKLSAQAAEYCDLQRIESINRKTIDYPWIQVDPWASIWCKTDYNFTTLYERFRKYCQYWIPSKKVKVYYLYGGDNYLFSNAFLKYGYGVCVPRDSYSIDKEKVYSNRVIYSDFVVPNYASKKIRTSLQNQKESTLSKEIYLLRDDLAFSLPDTSSDFQSSILKRILNSISDAFNSKMEFSVLDIDSQMEHDFGKENLISLDAFYKAKYNIESTRLFYCNDKQTFSNQMVARVGFEDLDYQMSKIPSSEYTLVDDDIATGFTMDYIIEKLKEHSVMVKSKESLITDTKKFFDVVDTRDFIIGARYGGLTVTNGIFKTRFPYVYPYVNLSTRAKMPAKNIVKFSRAIWELNYDLYKDSLMKLKDIQTQDFMVLGFDAEMTVKELCQFHLDLFD